MSLGILIFILSILVVVMIHESGHFLTAKLFDFKATKFFVGFGPTVWSTQRGETEYGIKAIPAGGFVKIVGMNPYEEVPAQDIHRSYPNKPAWQRAIVLAAGSATHWVVAFVILMVTAMTIGFPTGRAGNEVAAVSADSPAVAAGFEAGDEIVGVGGQGTTSWNDIRRYIRAHPEERVEFTVVRDDERVPLEVELGRAIYDERGAPVAFAEPGESLRAPRSGEQVVGFLGVQPTQLFDRMGPLEAAGDAAVRTGQLTVASAQGVVQIFGMVFDGTLVDALTGEGRRAPDEGPLGLVGAGRIAGESVQTGRYLDLIGLVVGFTVFVGLMNLLPLPPLDGGHLAVVAWEAVTGRKVDLRKLIPVAAAVISFFLLLFVAVLYLDIARPIKIPL